MSKVTQSNARQSYLYITFFTTPCMPIMLSIYLNSSTCIYLSLDNGITMTLESPESKKNLVSLICFSVLSGSLFDLM